MSQNNAAAYLLAFLVISVASVSAIHASANLRGLQVTAEPVESVFQGEDLAVQVLLRALPSRTHYGLRVTAPGCVDAEPLPPIAAGQVAKAVVALDTPQRGRFGEVTLELSSTFPLGFFTARRQLTLAQPHHVFPQPHGEIPLPVDDAKPMETRLPTQRQGDDFAGVRDWRVGESMRHVDWKAVARGQRAMVKQWAGGESAHFIFDEGTLAGLDQEDRLRQLARWVVQAARMGAVYELRLRGGHIPLGHGEAHLHTCLKRLAEVAHEPTAQGVPA